MSFHKINNGDILSNVMLSRQKEQPSVHNGRSTNRCLVSVITDTVNRSLFSHFTLKTDITRLSETLANQPVTIQ
jgi:hypothetical protein